MGLVPSASTIADCSDRAGRYLRVPELPYQLGSWRAQVHYPASHDDRQSMQAYPPRSSQPQARSVEPFDVLMSSSDYAPSNPEGEDDEPVGSDERGSQLTLNLQPSNSKRPPDDRWKEYCKKLGTDKRTRTDIYQCCYVEDNGPGTPCGQQGAKSTIKRHINAVHLRIR